MQTTNKKNSRIIKMLAHLNCQTDVLEVVNHCGVVIQVPAVRNEDLPNLVALLDPSLKWCGTNPVCLDKEEKKVYSNVTKFIQLVVWTCMHPKKDSSGVPFHFAWDKEATKKFFSKSREKGQGWMSINENEKEKAELIGCPLFKVIGHKKPVTLFELLHVILDHDIKTDSEAWQAWDTLLKTFPETGITGLWSTPIAAAAIFVGAQNGKKYGDLCRLWGYRPDKKRKVADSGLDKMSNGLKETATRKPKSARGNRKPAPRSVAAATGEEASTDNEDEDEACSSSPPAEYSQGLSQNVNANSSARRHEDKGENEDEDEDEDDAVSELKMKRKPTEDEDDAEDDAVSELKMKRKPTDEGAGTGPVTFDSLVASVPRSAWDTPGDMDSTRAALLESANIHVQNALFALALSGVAKQSKKVPTKEDLTEDFPLTKEKDCKMVTQMLAQHFIAGIEGTFLSSSLGESEPSPGTSFGAYFADIWNPATFTGEDGKKEEKEEEEEDVKDKEKTKTKEQAEDSKPKPKPNLKTDSSTTPQETRKRTRSVTTPPNTATDVLIPNNRRTASASKPKNPSVKKGSHHNNPAQEMGKKQH
jgi:hypothetical protein